MPTFGIIGEGVTDQAVLKNILIGFFDDEPFVTRIQPPEPVPGEALPPGGWTLVLRSLAQKDHIQALEYNDYVVIHIDTDVSEQTGYDIPWRSGGQDLSVEHLVARVTDKLQGIIGADFYAAHRDRFIFAVAVHCIECWLLPLYHQDSHAKKTTGCLEAVNRALVGKGLCLTRGPDGEGKDPQTYRAASRDFAKRRRLLQVCDKNPSLALFVRQLAAIALPAPNPVAAPGS